MTAVLATTSISTPSPSPADQALFPIYKQLVEINTVDPSGDNTRAAEAMAARL
ncbi:MAG: peptidase M20, partial [Acidobacteria bacterium]